MRRISILDGIKRALLSCIPFFMLFQLSARQIVFTVIDSEIDIPLEGVVLELKVTGSQNAQSDEKFSWETDFDGNAVADIPDEIIAAGAIITAKYPGYPDKIIKLDKNAESVQIGLSMSFEEVLEGKELVVEQQAYHQTDAESGISVVITKDQFDTAAQIGAIPDIMTVVKMLPGVTFSGQFSQQPSIRGGYPFEMASVLDGMYVSNPYHWAGTVSIFDPMFVSSVKLSHGVFSARYGHATSGLLDVTSVTPDDTPRFDASFSSLQTDGVLQLPIGNNFSLTGGYRITYNDTWPWLLDKLQITPAIYRAYNEGENIPDFYITDYIKRFPYMHDFYLKAIYKPFDRLSFALTGFYGDEGIKVQIDENSENSEGEWKSHYDPYDWQLSSWDKNIYKLGIVWDNIFTFASLRTKWLPTDNLQIEAGFGYNYYNRNLVLDFYNFDEWEKVKYHLERPQIDPKTEYDPETQDDPENQENPENQEQPEIQEKTTDIYDVRGMVAEYTEIPPDEVEAPEINPNDLDDEYHKNENSIYFQSSYYISLYQAKINADYYIDQNNILSFGIEEFFKSKSTTNILKWHSLYYNKNQRTGCEPEINENYDLNIPYDVNVRGNNLLNSVGYATWALGNETSKLQGELGLRVDHYLLYNKKSNLNQNMVPTFNPRIYARYNVFKDKKFIESLNVSAGAGLFSLMSDAVLDLPEAYKIQDGKIKPDMNFFGIVGTQFDFLQDYSFQLEAYYKYYFNRYYASGILNSNLTILHSIIGIDGGGYVNKAFCDGKGYATGFDMMLQKKTGRYFDGYLTYSFIVARYLNPYKPKREGAVTDTTNEPMGEWYYPYFHRFNSLMAVINWRPVNGFVFTVSGGIVGGVPIKANTLLYEIFGENQIFASRAAVSCPLNIRLGFSDFYRSTKCKIEWYLGVENVLGFLSRSSVFGTINYMTTHPDEDKIFLYADNIANFDVGLPMLSIGFRLSY